eukprot:1254525-Rhodomonas_salina.1
MHGFSGSGGSFPFATPKLSAVAAFAKNSMQKEPQQARTRSSSAGSPASKATNQTRGDGAGVGRTSSSHWNDLDSPIEQIRPYLLAFRSRRRYAVMRLAAAGLQGVVRRKLAAIILRNGLGAQVASPGITRASTNPFDDVFGSQSPA